MAKLGWKLAHGPNNLAKVLSYQIISINHKKNGSPLWKSVGKGWEILQEYSAWMIGDGMTTSSFRKISGLVHAPYARPFVAR